MCLSPRCRALDWPLTSEGAGRRWVGPCHRRGETEGLRGISPLLLSASGPTELPLPPLHDHAAPGRDLPLLGPVQGAGSVFQPQGPSGAQLD